MTFPNFNIPFNPYAPKDPRFNNLTGQRFERWLVFSIYGYKMPKKTTLWLCRCDCGNWKVLSSQQLTAKTSKSCGCYRAEVNSSIHLTHGEASGRTKPPTSEYRSYHSAKNRCNNPNNSSYKDYGGRGIKFLFESFEQFVSVLGRKPTPSHSLERKNNNGHYSPENCRWATRREQMKNRQSNRYITYNGQTKLLAEWNAEGFSRHRLTDRLRKGWCTTCAFQLPKFEKCPHILKTD